MADKSEAGLHGKTLHSLRVVDLRNALEKRGLPKSGNKKELVERLKLQLKIEKLHEECVKAEDRVPNLDLQDELAGQNDFVKQYLAAQQQTYAMQLKERRLAEMQACCGASEQADSQETASKAVVPSSTGGEKGSCRESWEHPCEGRTCPSSIDPGGAAGHSPTQDKPPVEVTDPPVETCRSRLRHRRQSPLSSVKRGRIKPAGQGKPKQSVQPELNISSDQNEPCLDVKVQRVVRSPRKGAVAPAISPPPIEGHYGQRYPSRRKRQHSGSEGSARDLQRSEHTVITTTTSEEVEHDVEIHPAASATEQYEQKECAREKRARLARQPQELKIGRRTTRRVINTAPAMPMTLSKDTTKAASILTSCTEKASNKPTSPQHSSSGVAELNYQGTSNLVQCPVVEGSEERGKPLRMLITRTGTTKSRVSCSRVNMQSELLSVNAARAHPNILFTQVPCDVLSESTLQSTVTKDDVKQDQNITPSSSSLPSAQVGDDLHETLNKLHITTEAAYYKENSCSVQRDALHMQAAAENIPSSDKLAQNDKTLNGSTSGKCTTNAEQTTTFQKEEGVQVTLTAPQETEIMAVQQDLDASTCFSEGHNIICANSITADSSTTFTRPSSRKSLIADCAIDSAANIKDTATYSAEEKSVHPAAVTTQEVVLAVLKQQELNASLTSADGDNATGTGSIAANTSISPSRPSVRRSLTAAETTSAVQSILQTTEEILVRSEHCHDVLEAQPNLIDEYEVGSATDSLLKEMSIGTEDDSDLQLTTTCLEAPEKVNTDDVSVTRREAAEPSGAIALQQSDTNGNRGNATEEIDTKATKSPDNKFCIEREPPLYKTHSHAPLTEKVEHTSMPLKDELSGLERTPEVSLSQARKLGQVAEVKTFNFPQSSDATGLVSEADATKFCSSLKEGTSLQRALEKGVSEKSTSAASATECLAATDSAKSLEGTSHKVSSGALAHNETRRPVGGIECLELSRAEILTPKHAACTLEDQELPPVQKAKKETASKSSLLEAPAASITIADSKVYLPEGQQAIGQFDDGSAQRRKLPSDWHASESRTALEGTQKLSPFKTEEIGLSSNMPSSEYHNADTALGTAAISLQSLKEMHRLSAGAAKNDAPLEMRSAALHLKDIAETNSEKLSSDGAEKPAVETSLHDEERLCHSGGKQSAKNAEAVVKSLCTGTHTTARPEGCSTCAPEPRKDSQVGASTLALVFNEQDALIDTSPHHGINNHKLLMEADVIEVLSPNIEPNGQCFSNSTELSSLPKKDLNECIYEATAKTKATSVSTGDLQVEDQTSLESSKLPEFKEDIGNGISDNVAAVEKAAESNVCNVVGATDDGQRSSQHPDRSGICPLTLPQDTKRQGEIPQEAISLDHKILLKQEKSQDETAMATHIASHKTDLTRSECTEILDEYCPGFSSGLAHNRKAHVKMDNSSDISNRNVSDRAITSSVPPMITASVAPLNMLAEFSASALCETCAETTPPCESDADFRVTQHQQQCQRTSSFRSCDSTTGACIASQHSVATSLPQMKQLVDVCNSTNAALSASEISETEDCADTVPAPDSTGIEGSALLHAGFGESSANSVSPASLHSASSIQGTKGLTVDVTSCSDVVKSAVPCQFSPPHTVTNMPRSTTGVQYMQDDTQVLTALDRGGASKQRLIVAASVHSDEGTVHKPPFEPQVGFAGAVDNCNAGWTTFQEENLSNAKKSKLCVDEDNSVSTGQEVPLVIEVKEGLKYALERDKQSTLPVHETSCESEDAQKLKDATGDGETEVFFGVVSEEHEYDKEIKYEKIANTQMNIRYSVKDTTHSGDDTTNEASLEREENDPSQMVKEHTNHHSSKSKQEAGGSDSHLSTVASERQVFTESAIMFTIVHEMAAPSHNLLQGSMNSFLPEHSNIRTGSQESTNECENAKDSLLQNLSTELISKPNEETKCGTVFSNTTVDTSQAIHEDLKTGVPLSNACKNDIASAYSHSAVLEDQNRCQEAEKTTAVSQPTEIKHSHTIPTKVKTTDEITIGLCTEDCSNFHSLTEEQSAEPRITRGNLADELPEPRKIEASRSSSVHKNNDQRTASEVSRTDIPDDRICLESSPKTESSLSREAISTILASESTINLQHEALSIRKQVVAKYVSKPVDSYFTSKQLNCAQVMNRSVDNASGALLAVEDTAHDWECVAHVPSINTSTGIHLGRSCYDTKGTREERDEIKGSNLSAPGSQTSDVITDVAAARAMEIQSTAEPQEDDAPSCTNAAQSSPTRSTEIAAYWESATNRLSNCDIYEYRKQDNDPFQQYSDTVPTGTCLQCDTRETLGNVLDLGDSSSSSSSGTNCPEGDKYQMARLRGRGVRKQVTTRAAKESSEATSDGEGGEAGNRRLRNGRRSTPEEPVLTRRSSRNRKVTTEDNPKEDSDAATEPESISGSPQPGEEQEHSAIQEEEEQHQQQQQKEPEQHMGKKGNSSSTSQSSGSSDGEEEFARQRDLKGVLASSPERHEPPPEQPSSPPTSEPAPEMDTKEQEDVKIKEEPAEEDSSQNYQSPQKEDKSAKGNMPEDVEIKDEEEKEPVSEASAPKFKTRRLSSAALKKESEEERPQRKRRWGSTNVVLGPSLSISTAALKDLIPDIEEPLSKPKEPEEEHLTASVGESPVTEIEETSDEPPIKVQVIDEEPTSEDVPPGDDSTENGKEGKDDDDEPSQDEKPARSERERSKDDWPSRIERFPRDEKERSLDRDEKGVKVDKPLRADEKHERHDARVRESKPARDKASPVIAPGAERKGLRVISDRAPLSKRSGAGKNEADKRKLTSPPRNPKSRVLFVRNLVRPFTLNQLKQLLQEFGDTVDSEFWIDKIKSKCFVTYVTEEDSIKAREALHNLRWPLCNPKILHVDFSSPEEMARHKEPPTPPPQPAVAATGERTAPAFQRTVEVDTRVPAGREVLRDPRELLRDPRESRDNRESREPKDPREARGSFSGPPSRTDRSIPVERQSTGKRSGMPMREWDRDKVRQDTPPPPPAERAQPPSRNRPHSPPEKRERRDKKLAKRKPEEDTPAKLLDDLFRKTKASPCIYWLPLTEEQVAHKEEERKQRRQERERRRQQQQLQEEEERRKRALARDVAGKTKQESKRSGSRSPIRRR